MEPITKPVEGPSRNGDDAAAYKFRIALEAVEGGKTIGRSSNARFA